MSHALYFWVERYLFSPSFIQKILSFSLLPLSLLYCAYVTLKRKFTTPQNLHIPIISVGNLLVGGTGKTPLTIALAQDKPNLFIVLRGYKRESKGLVLVSHKGKVHATLKEAGDEAMLYATSLKNASVIVSEDRIKGIQKAKSLGAQVIFLDDGFSKSHIQKLDILLKPKQSSQNTFCLPSGPFREPSFNYQRYLTLQEDRDFTRQVKVPENTQDMLFITAISKPQRLEAYLPEGMQKVYFPDHYHFSQEELQALLTKHQKKEILTTSKDAVKMQDFGIHLSLIRLSIMIESDIHQIVDDFIENFGKISKN